jgi:hypothetical protein
MNINWMRQKLEHFLALCEAEASSAVEVALRVRDSQGV